MTKLAYTLHLYIIGLNKEYRRIIVGLKHGKATNEKLTET